MQNGKPKNNKLLLVPLFVGLYLLSSGASYLVFSSSSSGQKAVTPIDSSKLNSARSKIGEGLPKTEVCPINGAKFSTVERGIWENRRPITAIIENHLDSRPQSGLSRADIVYEAVAEGGITRFLGVFYCGASAGDVRIGPVRSARVYFVKWAHEYGMNPIFVHVGGANNVDNKSPNGLKAPGQVAKEVDAFKLLIDLGWRHAQGNSMDGGTSVGFPVMWRDPERIPGAATEHTFMGSTDKLFEEGIKRGYGAKNEKGIAWSDTFIPWKFEDGAPVSNSLASEISFEFWRNKPDYDVVWKYSAENNEYLRTNGGKPHVDMENENGQLSAKNLVIQFVTEKGPVDKEYHMYYENFGTGKALIFKNGEVIEGTWKRTAMKDRTIFTDKSGKEIVFVRGVVWVHAIPSGNTINYK